MRISDWSSDVCSSDLRWRGTPRGHEGQALAWVPPDKLPGYAMPPADRPVVAALLQPDRYLVTPSPATPADDEAWLNTLQRALASGVRRIQARLPGLDPARRRDRQSTRLNSSP